MITFQAKIDDSKFVKDLKAKTKLALEKTKAGFETLGAKTKEGFEKLGTRTKEDSEKDGEQVLHGELKS